MLEWEEGDRSSFEDSERFEEDSLCSWQSEPESLCNNWRGWKKSCNINMSNIYVPLTFKKVNDGKVPTLVELCACTVATHIPFEVVEQMMPVVPEQIQKWIAFWSFPENEEDIRLYSCLANGNVEEFNKGENIYLNNAVLDMLQIGFHLSATVSISNGTKGKYKVAVTFDRGRITTCTCTCNASWCSHIVAVCLNRINKPSQKHLRAPVSESLSRLHRDQLQKFAQYLISELPQQILPTAQRLIDEILSSQPSDINTVSGAPDPTAGASAGEKTAWWLDDKKIRENIKKILVKFCIPTPMVYSDVNYLSSVAPPVAMEWQSLLRPLRGREPEGMWNLMSIVREMFKRHDHNAIPLLEIITEACLSLSKILVWWVNTKVALHVGSSTHGGKNSMNSNSHGSQYACSSLCDEVVTLWRLAALNPALSPSERVFLKDKLRDWHLKVLDEVAKSKETTTPNSNNGANKRNDLDIFPGFKPAIEACYLDWNDYPLSGITYSPTASSYYCPVMCRSQDIYTEGFSSKCSGQVASTSSKADFRKLYTENSGSAWLREKELLIGVRSCHRSNSISSEGFCDNDLGSDSPPDVNSPDSGQVSRENSKDDSHISFVSQDSSTHPRTPGELDVFDYESWPSYRAIDVAGCTDEGSLLLAAGVSPPDEYGMYVYNPQMLQDLSLPLQSTSKEGSDIFASIKKLEDPLEILFARAEGLHTHGHIYDASKLAVQLSKELLANPPNLMVELPVQNVRGKKRKINPASHQITCHASDTLAKCAFLCSVLSEDFDNTHLAFQVGIFGLIMPRPPASTKPLEVKLAHQESELVNLLKRLPLGNSELKGIREMAEQIRTNTFKSRGEALLPLMLASFIFDALVASASNRSGIGQGYRLPSDEILGFEEAVAALGMKANVCEADHPLLCEGTRRQRGDLALTLLTYYKDDQNRLAVIMDKFLDKEVHQMYKAPSLPKYYINPTVVQSPTTRPEVANACLVSTSAKVSSQPTSNSSKSVIYSQCASAAETDVEESVAKLSLSLSQPVGGARPKDASCLRYTDEEKDANTTVDSTEGESLVTNHGWEEDYKAWKENNKKNRFHASLDAPAGWVKPTSPGSDSGSSGNSSDSVGSFSSTGDKGVEINKPADSPPLNFHLPIIHQPLSEHMSSSRPPPMYGKGIRFKGKRPYPTIPNQPSEAGAYFMCELAKTVLNKAGGNSSTSLFKQPSSSKSHGGPHRGLQMSAFQIGLYGLGLNNCVSPNWLSRTYSSQVSWISNQATEIGAPAVSFLINTWEGHLTPQEAASIADKASRGKDAQTIEQAAMLALSCLPHSHALNPIEVQRAITQCKEQSDEMLEKACLNVQEAAKDGAVFPEVLFFVARCWYELYESRTRNQARLNAARRASQENSHENSTEMAIAPLSSPESSTGPSQISVAQFEQPSITPVTVSLSPSMHNNNSIHAYPLATATPYGVGFPYPVGYSYIPGLTTSVSCIAPQVPVQMYIQPSAVSFNGSQPSLSQPVLPSPQYYYPPVTITSSLAQVGGTSANPQVVSQLANIASISTSLASATAHSSNLNQSNALLGNTGQPPPQGFFPLAYSGTNGFLSGSPQGSSLIPFVRAQGLSSLAQPSPHNQIQLPATSQPQQQVRAMLVSSPASGSNSRCMEYLMNAYKVGMLAMETLARRVDERPQTRYNRNPPYGEEVKWLLEVAKKLGTQYLHQFCLCCVSSIVSPFVLYDLAVEVAQFLSHNSAALYHQHLKSPIVSPLVQKCQQMFVQSTNFKMHYITPSDYDDLIALIRAARLAFQMTPGGMVQFGDLLQAVRRSKNCKKELWQRITGALQQPSNV